MNLNVLINTNLAILLNYIAYTMTFDIESIVNLVNHIKTIIN